MDIELPQFKNFNAAFLERSGQIKYAVLYKIMK